VQVFRLQRQDTSLFQGREFWEAGGYEQQGKRKNTRRVPDIPWFIWAVIVWHDLPGLLVVATDHACAFLSITVDREIPSEAVLDAEEVITSIFEDRLSRLSKADKGRSRWNANLLIGTFMDRISDYLPIAVSLETAQPMNNTTIINAVHIYHDEGRDIIKLSRSPSP
jgi:hypothetical protein